MDPTVSIFQERVAHLETHKNRLEATLSPLLITAFTNKDTESALRLVKMFRTIERDKQQLSKYYHKCVRASLLQKWSEIVSDNEGETCDKILDLWFTLLARELGEDKTWVETVFTDQDKRCKRDFHENLLRICFRGEGRLCSYIHCKHIQRSYCG